MSESLGESLERGKKQRQAKLLKGVAAILASVLVVAALVYFSRLLTADRPSPTPVASVDEASAGDDCEQAPDGSEACDARALFLDEVKRFQRELKPALDGVSLAQWAAREHDLIVDTEQQALGRFDAGDYPDALRLIRETSALAEQQLERAAERFASTLALAQSSYDDGDAAAAGRAIDSALQIDPDDAEASALKDRIDVLPAVLEQLDKAAVARAENRPGVERDALEQVLKLDPQRTAAAERLQNLKANGAEARYAQVIRNAERALDGNELEAARGYLEQARRLAPNRDLGFLAQRLEQQEKRARLDRALAAAEAAQRRDDWKAAQVAFADALRVDGADARAVAGHAQASAIVDGVQALDRILVKPLRLGSPRIADAAQQELDRYRQYAGASPALASRLGAVSDYLAQAKVPVDVAVLSDGKTHVEVRRVGIVGRHEEKVIQLTPGEYQLEGSRQGFKSTIVDLEVPFGGDRVEVRVECRERI
ncbi:MAG: hypothetical protein AAGD86_00180 [Pseudomonadota bacterium]